MSIENITFEWTSNLPSSPPKEQIEESVWATIDMLPGVRNLKPLVRTISLRSTFLEMGVEGVAYDNNGKPIIALKYIWSPGNGKGMACAYDDPQKGQLLNL